MTVLIHNHFDSQNNLFNRSMIGTTLWQVRDREEDRKYSKDIE